MAEHWTVAVCPVHGPRYLGAAAKACLAGQADECGREFQQVKVVPLASLTALADEWEKRAEKQHAIGDEEKDSMLAHGNYGSEATYQSCARDLRNLLASTQGYERARDKLASMVPVGANDPPPPPEGPLPRFRLPDQPKPDSSTKGGERSNG